MADPVGVGYIYANPANMRRWANVGLLLAHRLRHNFHIKTYENLISIEFHYFFFEYFLYLL